MSQLEAPKPKEDINDLLQKLFQSLNLDDRDLKERKEAFSLFIVAAKELAGLVGGIDRKNISVENAKPIATKLKELSGLLVRSHIDKMSHQKVKKVLDAKIGEEAIAALKLFNSHFFNDKEGHRLFGGLVDFTTMNTGLHGLLFIIKDPVVDLW